MTDNLTPLFDTYVAPARLRPQIWRLVLGAVVIVLVYALWLGAMFLCFWLIYGGLGAVGWVGIMAKGLTPTGTLLLLFSFLGMALGPMVAVRLIHKRSVASLFGRGAVVLRDFVRAGGVVLLLFGGVVLVWTLKFDAVPNLELKTWLLVLPLSLIGLAIQTGAEELVFRGYLMQQLAARFRSPIVWMLLPALAFGAVHYDPTTAGSNTWMMMAAAAGFGLVAGDLTRITGSIGAAWGFHFASNLIAILFVAVDGTIPGLALYLTPYTASDTVDLPTLIAIDFSVMALAWLVLRRILRR